MDAAFLSMLKVAKRDFRSVTKTETQQELVDAPRTATYWDNTNCQQYGISILFSPLIGGPEILPIHCSILLEDGGDKIVWADFLPATPTDPSTLRQLTLLQTVPGLVRYKCNKRMDDIFKRRNSIQLSLPFSPSISSASLQEYCIEYQERYGGLNLLTNNCYHFCVAILLQLLIQGDDK